MSTDTERQDRVAAISAATCSAPTPSTSSTRPPSRRPADPARRSRPSDNRGTGFRKQPCHHRRLGDRPGGGYPLARMPPAFSRCPHRCCRDHDQERSDTDGGFILPSRAARCRHGVRPPTGGRCRRLRCWRPAPSQRRDSETCRLTTGASGTRTMAVAARVAEVAMSSGWMEEGTPLPLI